MLVRIPVSLADSIPSGGGARVPRFPVAPSVAERGYGARVSDVEATARVVAAIDSLGALTAAFAANRGS